MARRLEKNLDGLLQFLSGLQIFSEFTKDEIRALLRIMEEWGYEQGEHVFNEGDPGDSCYLIVDGSIGVSKSLDSVDKSSLKLSKLKPGTIFGQVSLIDRGPRSASCVALEKTALLKLQRNAFDALFHTGHPTAYKFQDIIAQIMTQQLRLADHALARMIHELEKPAATEESMSVAAEKAAAGASATIEWHEDVDSTANAVEPPPPGVEKDFIEPTSYNEEPPA